MKKLVLLTIALTMGFMCNAQYRHNDYITPEDVISAIETTKLNNIRFDVNVFKETPEVWNNFQEYVKLNESLEKKRNTFSIVAWSGLGVGCLAFIPLVAAPLGVSTDGYMLCSQVMVGVGAAAMLVGGIGASIQMGKMKSNKKEFIYYLKTTNNGVGIVTLF